MYIFEDKQQDLLSQLFRSGYPAEVESSFIYADGVGNLVPRVEQALEGKDQDDIYGRGCRQSRNSEGISKFKTQVYIE